MRKFLIIVACLALLILPLASSARVGLFGGGGSSISTPPTATLTGITLTLATPPITTLSPSGTTAGTIAVQATGGTFNGTLALDGTDSDASFFTIAGTTLKTVGTLSSGNKAIHIIATMTGAAGSPLRVAFLVPVPQPAINAVVLGSNTFPAGSPSGTVVAPISVQVSSGSFTGTLALTGADAGSFTISGGNLLTNGVLGAATYNFNIVPTQPGYLNSGSPFAQTVTGTTAVANTMTMTNVTGATVTNYPWQFGRMFKVGEITHFPQIVWNGTPVTTQVDVKNRYPDGSVKYAIMAYVVPSLTNSVAANISFQDQLSPDNTPVSLPTMESMLPIGTAKMTLTPVTGTPGSADAGQMLADGNCKLWTSGPIAQTVECADDTATARYDIGFDGTYHPFRPRFYVTFWPTLSKSFIRFVGECCKTTEITDLFYNLSIVAGTQNNTVDLTVTGSQPRFHEAFTNWTKKFWLGGAPPDQINIDNNLAYMASTKFLANFDSTLSETEAMIANYYNQYFTTHSMELYSSRQYNNGVWSSDISSAGSHAEIGPIIRWTAYWLFSHGDWRMRLMDLALMDVGAAYPVHLRETNTGKRLSRYDAPGDSGFGHFMSVTDRKTQNKATIYANPTSVFPPSDRVTWVLQGVTNLFWQFDGAHQGDMYYTEYLETGDPFYLHEIYAWASFSMLIAPGPNPYGNARGPTGAEGGLQDEPRGMGWVLRHRAEAAFIAPDSDPEKGYFTYMTNDAIAKQLGNWGIPGGAYETDPPVPGSNQNMWQFGKAQGNPQSGGGGNNPPVATFLTTGPLHQYQIDWNPAAEAADPNYNPNLKGKGGDNSFYGNDACATEAWFMRDYLSYGIGRAKDMGFQGADLFRWIMFGLEGLVLDSGYPELMISLSVPTASCSTINWYQSWTEFVQKEAFQARYLNNIPYPATQGLHSNFLFQCGSAEGFCVSAAGALAMNADAGFATTRGSAAWAWALANVGPKIYYEVYPTKLDPFWAIIPRTDTYALPTVSTTAH